MPPSVVQAPRALKAATTLSKHRLHQLPTGARALGQDCCSCCLLGCSPTVQVLGLELDLMHALAGAHYGEVFERVALLQERPPIPPDMPEDYAALMVACWHPDPLARPTFRMVQQSLADILKVLPNSADRFFSDL